MLYGMPKELLKLYATHPVIWLKAGREYRDYSQGGKLIKEPPEEIVLEESVVTPLSFNDLKYDLGGTYTSNDRKLYTYTKIPKGDYIRYKGITYRIHEDKDYSDFTAEYNEETQETEGEGLFIYKMVRGDKE